MKRQIVTACSLFFGLVLLNALSGNTAHSWGETLSAAFGSSTDSAFQTILWQIRFPRAAAAAIAGAALAAAGVLSQGLFRNPIASPSILGTEGGGNLAAALCIGLGLTQLGAVTLPLAAFVGCLAVSLVLLASISVRRAATTEFLLLLGFSLGSLTSALTSLIITLQADDYRKVPMLMHWGMGSFSSADWTRISWAAASCVLGAIGAMLSCVKLDLLVLGEEIASTMGLSITRIRALTIGSISLLVAGAVSLGGAIPFVGLVVPHLSRKVHGPKHKGLLFFSMLHGATLTLAADLCARIVIRPEEIPVGVLTALVGAPFFFWMLHRGNGATND